jgi:hypothetical protein
MTLRCSTFVFLIQHQPVIDTPAISSISLDVVIL